MQKAGILLYTTIIVISVQRWSIAEVVRLSLVALVVYIILLLKMQVIVSLL